MMFLLTGCAQEVGRIEVSRTFVPEHTEEITRTVIIAGHPLPFTFINKVKKHYEVLCKIYYDDGTYKMKRIYENAPEGE